MKIERFEDVEAWQRARELTRMVYRLTQKPSFAKDQELRNQIRAAAGSAMHNVAEGFDSETNVEFIRFLRYAKRSCSEVQSELHLALARPICPLRSSRPPTNKPVSPAQPCADSSTICANMKPPGRSQWPAKLNFRPRRPLRTLDFQP